MHSLACYVIQLNERSFIHKQKVKLPSNVSPSADSFIKECWEWLHNVLIPRDSEDSKDYLPILDVMWRREGDKSGTDVYRKPTHTDS